MKKEMLKNVIVLSLALGMLPFVAEAANHEIKENVDSGVQTWTITTNIDATQPGDNDTVDGVDSLYGIYGGASSFVTDVSTTITATGISSVKINSTEAYPNGWGNKPVAVYISASSDGASTASNVTSKITFDDTDLTIAATGTKYLIDPNDPNSEDENGLTGVALNSKRTTETNIESEAIFKGATTINVDFNDASYNSPIGVEAYASSPTFSAPSNTGKTASSTITFEKATEINVSGNYGAIGLDVDAGMDAVSTIDFKDAAKIIVANDATNTPSWSPELTGVQVQNSTDGYQTYDVNSTPEYQYTYGNGTATVTFQKGLDLQVKLDENTVDTSTTGIHGLYASADQYSWDGGAVINVYGGPININASTKLAVMNAFAIETQDQTAVVNINQKQGVDPGIVNIYGNIMSKRGGVVNILAPVGSTITGDVLATGEGVLLEEQERMVYDPTYGNYYCCPAH